MRLIFELFWTILVSLFEPVIDFVKLEVFKAYVYGVACVRTVYLSLLFHLFAVVLALAGFLLIHFAIFFLLPWSLQVNALVLLIVGVFYLVIPLLYIVKKASIKNWAKMSDIDMFKKL